MTMGVGAAPPADRSGATDRDVDPAPATGLEPNGAIAPAATVEQPRSRLPRLPSAASVGRRTLLLLLVVYLLKQLFSVAAFPAFSGHDELAHQAYVSILAREGRLPTIPDLDEWRAARAEAQTFDDRSLPGDDLPDELYPWCKYVLDWHCAPTHPQWGSDPPRAATVQLQYYPMGWVYTANHPPLYYALMVPVFKLTEGWGPLVQQYALRLAAIPFGIATVILAWLLARTLFPGDAFLAVTVPAFVAFQPQISYEAAMVNNDIVAITGFALILWLLALGIRDKFPDRIAVLVGVAFGLSLLAKGTSLLAGPLIALAVVLALGWRDWKGILRTGLLAGLPALLLVGPWWLFMLQTYGNLDAFAQIAELQFWSRAEGGFVELLVSVQLALLRIRETWGEYGWRLIRLGDNVLLLIALATIVCIAGLITWAVLVSRRQGVDRVERPERWQRAVLWVLLAACVVGYLAVVQFGTQFALTQARYYFPVVTAAALLSMLGLRTLIPARRRPFGQAATVAVLLALNVWLFVAYVLPFHSSQIANMPWLTGR
jgi:hypothetical protein